MADSFAAIDYFERLALPFVVGVNCFEGTQRHACDDVRDALSVSDDVPVVLCDARERSSARDALVRLVEHAITLASARG